MTTPATSSPAATAAGTAVDDQVAAETRYDSAWSDVVSHTTAPDTSPPPAPSAAQTARSGATVRVRADGLGQFGEAMPADVTAGGVFEVHLSTAAVYVPTTPAQRAAPGFDLAGDTLRLELAAGVTGTITGLSTSATYYVLVVARDATGNRSAPSPAVAV